MTATYLTLKLEIDWDKDGTYTDESARVKVLNTRRGRNAVLSSSGPERMAAGEMWATLRNYDNRYDPFNTGSELTGYVMPGRPCRVTVTRGSTTYPVFAGWLTDIRPTGAAREEAFIKALDGLAFLDMQQCDAAATQTNYAVSDAIEDLLAQAEWPFVSSVTVFPFTWPLTLGSTSIEDNGDVIASFAPDTDNTILTEMNNIADAWSGLIYARRDGTLAYKARDARRATVLTLTADDVQREIETRMPWQDIYNDVRITPNGTTAPVTAVNSTSRANFGRRTMSLSNNPYIEDAAQAASLSEFLMMFAPELKRGFRVKFVRDFEKQFVLELTDRARLTIARLGVDEYFQVGQIEHEFRSAGNCVTTIQFEPDSYAVAGLQVFPFTWPLNLGW